jgi:serine/threonine protein kinase
MQVDSNLTIPPQDLLFHEKVGEGSYGEVWRGTWQGSGGGETVAIKKIKTVGVSEKILQKLYSEVCILQYLTFYLYFFVITSTSSEVM